MSTFLLIPGAGGAAWYWHPVAERLAAAGHTAIALELPADDPDAGLSAYIDLAVAAAGDRDGLVVAAHSLGAFTAVPLCERLAVARLVLLNAMIPAPGERAGDWAQSTGSEEARLAAARAGGYPQEIDAETYFFHDVPRELVAESGRQQHDEAEAEAAFAEPCPFTRAPEVPTTVLAGRDERLFPFELQRRLARERLGIEAQPVPGGHLATLSHPDAIARALLR